MRLLFGVLFSILSFSGFSQSDSTTVTSDSVIELIQDPISLHLDSAYLAFFYESETFTTDTSRLNVMGYAENEKPLPSDSIIAARLDELDKLSPIRFDAHKDAIAYCKLYTIRRKRLTSRMLGAAELYFPVFEEYLAKYDIPQELKYLAIVESALKATAKSHMGASGLWQFMPRTAKGRGLIVESYLDERSHLFKSTDAACRYLIKLNNIYDDWQLALAAYNSGPGNVNKAIRRSGGKTNFWLIKNNLPKETQGYVPAFIGCVYAMKYHKEHNIYPTKPKFKFFELDTLHVNKRLDLDTVAKYLNLPIEDVSFLNPTFTNGIIPKMEESQMLTLPRLKIGEFETKQDSIYAKSRWSSSIPKIKAESQLNLAPNEYRVKSGDYLGKIAGKFNCRVSDIKKWNRLSSDKLRVGQKLVVYTPKKSSSSSSSSTKKTTVTKPKQPSKPYTGKTTTYTIKKGDTLWDVANRYNNVSVDEIKKLNSHLNFRNLKTGTKIKIPQK